METSIKAVVLAAGKGTRLQTETSDAPKVMRQACGKPLLRYVLDAISFIGEKDTILVVGYKKDEVMSQFDGYVFAEQKEQLCTGHAVMAARGALSGFDGAILVCYGDMPVIKRGTYEALIETHAQQGNACTLLSGESSIPLPYGRVIRGADGAFERVVEDRDCTPQQRELAELNSGVYVFDTRLLFEALGELRNDNSQGEYYLTDVPAIMKSKGAKVGICKRSLGEEIIGVNTVEQLAQVEAILDSALSGR